MIPSPDPIRDYDLYDRQQTRERDDDRLADVDADADDMASDVWREMQWRERGWPNA